MDHAREEAERLREAIEAALYRYDRPDEPHNKQGGFPRGELAWAMANDLRKALIPQQEDEEIHRILSLSDDEIRAETRAEGLDPEQVAAEMRALVEQAVKAVKHVLDLDADGVIALPPKSILQLEAALPGGAEDEEEV